jgi:hypothetical protein
VAGNQIFTRREIAFLKELAKRKVPFIIVGASAAALQGAPVVTQDIDLWFKDLNDPGIGKALAKVGGTLVPQVGLNPPMLAGGGVELFDVVLTMHGLEDFAAEEKNCLAVDLGGVMVKVLGLDRIIKSKETVGRRKDLLVLPVLRDALRAAHARQRGGASVRGPKGPGLRRKS